MTGSPACGGFGILHPPGLIGTVSNHCMPAQLPGRSNDEEGDWPSAAGGCLIIATPQRIEAKRRILDDGELSRPSKISFANGRRSVL